MSRSLRYTPGINPVHFNLAVARERQDFAERAVAISRGAVDYPNHAFWALSRSSKEADEVALVRNEQLSNLVAGVGIVATRLGGNPHERLNWLGYGYAYATERGIAIGSLNALATHQHIIPEIAYNLLDRYSRDLTVDDSTNALRILYEGDFGVALQHTEEAHQASTPMVVSSRNPDESTVYAYRRALLHDFLTPETPA